MKLYTILKAYTAVDLSVSDSIRKLDTYVPSVSIRLDQAKAEKLGQKLFLSLIHI